MAAINTDKNELSTVHLFNGFLAESFADPDGLWEWKPIGDVLITTSGGTPLKQHKEYYENGTVPWVVSGEVAQGEVWNTANFITESGLAHSSAKLFPPNTVLVAMYGATAGMVGILKIKAATNQAVCGILPSSLFLPEFLYFALLFKQQALVKMAEGNAQPNISQAKIRVTTVPVIPIQVQHELVRRLQETKASIEDVAAILKRKSIAISELRMSLLDAAFAGRM